MKTFAVIKNNIVENIVVGESLEILSFLIPEADLILEVTEKTFTPVLGGEYSNGKFIPAKPYASWIFDVGSWSWKSPKPYPSDEDGPYEWDDELTSWTKVIFP